MTEQEQEQQQVIFDKIRAEADKKRQARIEEKTKAAEFFARIKNGDDSLKRINQRLAGENK
jgi:hypothetical protein